MSYPAFGVQCPVVASSLSQRTTANPAMSRSRRGPRLTKLELSNPVQIAVLVNELR